MRSSSSAHSSENKKADKSAILLIGLLFYLGWFGAIYFAKWGYALYSLVFPAALIVLQLKKRLLSRQKLLWALSVVVVGVGFDAGLLHFGLIESPLAHSGIPTWLVSIWLLFGFSMMSLGVRFSLPNWVLVLLGAVFGPLSYKSGEMFGVLNFTSASTTWIYAIFWMLMFPGIVFVSRKSEDEQCVR